MTDLGTVNGDPNSIAYGINSEGQVVGGSQDSSFNFLHAFLWEKGSMSDLNALIPANLAVQLTVALPAVFGQPQFKRVEVAKGAQSGSP